MALSGTFWQLFTGSSSRPAHGSQPGAQAGRHALEGQEDLGNLNHGAFWHFLALLRNPPSQNAKWKQKLRQITKRAGTPEPAATGLGDISAGQKRPQLLCRRSMVFDLSTDVTGSSERSQREKRVHRRYFIDHEQWITDIRMIVAAPCGLAENLGLRILPILSILCILPRACQIDCAIFWTVVSRNRLLKRDLRR